MPSSFWRSSEPGFKPKGNQHDSNRITHHKHKHYIDKQGEDNPEMRKWKWLNTMSHQDADYSGSLEKKSSKQKINE